MIRQERKAMRVLISRTVKEVTDLPAGGRSVAYKSVPDGSKVGDVVVEIDLNGIFEKMGARALRSRGHKCVSGFVTVKARNVRHET